MSSSSTTVCPDVGPYKGKITHRSWAQLPEELVRQIATFYILDMSSNRTYPTMWDFRELWHARMAYTAIRDGMELERIMAVCPQWLKSREYEFSLTLDAPSSILGPLGRHEDL
ncbi:uncharacterized protein EV420DRAFT_1276306 [Desarmillaria tabescens]|uniref:Uncharacterized protein n=1 Tax=Armillaria tabescens TaxID=1929756 RepID=A0AA39JR87_ARMTA|nr:uncharacterized protein EV420DRAFT_1276306 [Desarmillaria tabescens]KAK0447042.1 hypothetical protein EV420DRAFT_1276306 [Desarmillaria tabescens]